MPRTTALAVASLVALLCLTISLPAHAVKLRRPYDTNVAFNYGFDEQGGGGCKDWNCGSHCYDGHTGTDHPLVVGSTVRAAASGTVVATNNGCSNTGYVGNTCGGRCGNYVKIQHADGQYTLYCHMKLNSLVVSTNDHVNCGDKIGLTASSGSSSGPHLHMSWRTSSNVNKDPFAGSCSNSSGAWRQQNGYRQAVGTSCGCTPSNEVCDGKDNDCDNQTDEGEVCEVDYLVQAASTYAPPRTTDINGDGLQDACGRFGNGWGCYLATGDGWGEKIESGKMRDDGGWGSAHYYATIRTGDVDGDGLADVCARHSTKGYQCWRSTGDGFEHYADAAGYTNDAGWTDPGYYTTFRLADINGDGMDDVCARGPDGWSCRLSTGSGFGDTVDGPSWSDASGFNHAWYYGTIRTGDLNADGMDDVCIRHSRGYRCYTSNGHGFDQMGDLTDFSNDGGWDAMKYWSTFRLADYDGDGRDDVCARFYGGLRCLRSTDAGFDAPEEVKGIGDDSGWDDPSNYQTIRAGDVNGDAAVDFCARANAGMICFGLQGGQPFSVGGPSWSDDNSWDNPIYYQTIFMTDIDSDRRRDLCARSSLGLSCATRTDDGFASVPRLDDFTNDSNWNELKYYSTLRLGSGECVPETCNGFDDDCDGQVDEAGCDEPTPDAGNAGSDGGSGGDGGFADTGFADAGPAGSDGGVAADATNGHGGGSSSLGGKAACTAAGDGRAPVPLLWLLLVPFAAWWRRRQSIASKAGPLSVLVLAGLLLGACDQHEPADQAGPTDSPAATRQSELSEFSAYSPDARLLAVYGDWQLRGTLEPTPPRSDAPPRYRVELLRDGKAADWPLEELITNAVFVPGEPPAVAARMPDGRLLAVDLKTQAVEQIDDHVGFSVAVAANGCCVAYMKGDMGFQSTARVASVDGTDKRDIRVGDNGWAPAVSPDGKQVAWVAPTSDGQPAIWTRGVDGGAPEQLAVLEAKSAPSGPQPPFWTGQGIVFGAEDGAYVLGLDGEVVGHASGADGILVDLKTGRMFDTHGAAIDLSNK